MCGYRRNDQQDPAFQTRSVRASALKIPSKSDDSSFSLLSAVVNSCDDAIISKTLEGVITSWNRAAERIFGYSADEAVGRSIRMIIPADRQAEEDYILDRIRRGDKVDHLETIRRTKDGRMLNISLTVSPIHDAGGSIVGASKIARDLTGEKQAQSKLQGLAEDLATRDEYLAMVAHELRDPLNVLSLLWSASKASGSPVQQQTIEKSWKQLHRLVAMVDRMLDVGRIRSNNFTLDRQKVNLTELVHEIVGRFTIEKPESPIAFKGERPIEGNWDRLRLDEVVTNLISNALKYGMKRPVVVSVSEYAGDGVVKVSDQGIGIAKDDQERIFQAFERANASRKEGLGIGLWITKEIVEAHGGTIEVESEVGRGSTFVVRLPLSTTIDSTAGQAPPTQ